MEFLKINNLKKVYSTRFGGERVTALKDISFSVEEGEFISIMGESGSGKTTLLNILGSLDRGTTGEVLLEGENINKIKESQISDFRRKNLGFVFQDFNLLDTFSVKDNIFLPLVLGKEKYKVMEERIKPLARKLNITSILNKYPYEVSGGQKQRCAVGRALITNPKLILADEPTGALDSKSSEDLLNIFKDINKEGQTIIMVTHSIKAASKSNRVLFIKDGEIFHQIYRGNMKDDEMYEKISNSLAIVIRQGE